tara:strand:+ start:73329 stop:73916 length:588 start_codon:yes stop_codon:yes gene_type:complete
MNKLILFIVFLFSLSFNQEIWEKEIPPSSYLENLAITDESLHKNTLKYVSYGSVVLGIHLLNNWKEPHQELVSYIILITGLVGVIADKFILKNKSRTLPGKKFEKIKDITGEDREKLAYEILVELADKSRNDKGKKRKKKEQEEEKIKKYGPVSTGIQQLVSNFMINRFKENNPQYGMTPYEKTLDNYLNQVPLD